MKVIKRKLKFFTFGIIAAISTSCSRDSAGSTPTGGSGSPIPGSNPVTPVTNSYTDEQLLTMVKQDALKYFWDYAEVNSKLARERYDTDNTATDATTVTTGGSGFGLMTILVGIKNGYVSRAEAVSRLSLSLDFLQKADRFHGAWPHWINGSTGKVIPFSPNDDGADLVETSYLAQGLICVREFFKNSNDAAELALSQKADNLWKCIEFNWFTQGGQNTLYWHWSPNNGWQINLPVKGYNECLITYVLAAASPNYSISKAVYTGGWASAGNIVNSASQYGIPILAYHQGAGGSVGPMFFSHYSFLGLDPRGLSDDYLNYGNVVTNHAKIMYSYCVANPKGFGGYSAKNWGLTASYDRNADGSIGYSAHQPSNDDGVISPTAALSSLPYTPTESMNVLRFIYNENYSKYVGVCGPYDAYSVHYNWVAPRYLAIDQGTIAPMAENYRTQFLWNLFMNASDVRAGLVKLGFHSTAYGF